MLYNARYKMYNQKIQFHIKVRQCLVQLLQYGGNNRNRQFNLVISHYNGAVV